LFFKSGGIAFAALGLPSRDFQSSSKPDKEGLPSLRSAFPPGTNTAQEKKAAGSGSLPFAFCILPLTSELVRGPDAKRLQTCLQPFFLVA
ncbi:MAG: hypothetical protein WC257_08350, partial [Bacteroidales bacterium]